MFYIYIYSFSDYFLLQIIKNIEYSSLCYTVGPCWLFILYIECVYVNPNFLIYPSPHPLSPLVTVSLFSMSVSLFLFCK